MEATGGTTLASNLVDIDSLVEHNPMTPREPRMMESPKQTDEAASERSRDPSPDISHSESHSEDGLEKICDPDAHGRYVKVIAKAEAPPVTVEALFEKLKCAEAEREANAYQKMIGANQADHQRMDAADEGKVLQPTEAQAGLPVVAPVEALIQVDDDDPGLGILEGHMADAVNAEAAKEEHNQYTVPSQGGKMRAMSELLGGDKPS